MQTTFEIWYMKPEYFREFIQGGPDPDPDNLEKTHVHLKDLTLQGGEAQLERVFYMMQGENWSPEGEARDLIEQKGLRHTSMSVGDVVRVGTRTLKVANFGFKCLKDTHPLATGEY